MKKNYAIVSLNGKQHQVKVGDVLTVDNLDKKAGDKFKSTDLLLLVTDQETLVGHPTLDKNSVEFEVVSNQASPKIRVATYRAKSRYRKVKGHRHPQTTLKVLNIK